MIYTLSVNISVNTAKSLPQDWRHSPSFKAATDRFLQAVLLSDAPIKFIGTNLM
ncbi:hypothetical protein [Maridesulfovibrio salexigens]|uniref:hypothetical protein n=1 Tax=Maridesulfovibrio salexigens TaxID=880 RepID=UPI0012ED83FE|nr:hypothetical protein [Maridesulfovibrio salexigens]